MSELNALNFLQPQNDYKVFKFIVATIKLFWPNHDGLFSGELQQNSI